jgi:hypothetical protein
VTVPARSTASRTPRRPVTPTAETPFAEVARCVLEQLTALVAEIERLRAENQALRTEMSDAATMLERANQALASVRRRRAGRGRQPSARRSRTRVTSEQVTGQMVRTALDTLGGEGTAAEIADEIGRSGHSVSGRAVRFLAEGAGAQSIIGEDGRRRYRGGDVTPPSSRNGSTPPGR